MAKLAFTINGREYNLTCDEGQEQRVMDLAAFVDGRMRDVVASAGGESESQHFVLTALMLADEIYELREQIQSAGGEPMSSGHLREHELAIAGAINTLAERIEGIAGKVEEKVG